MMFGLFRKEPSSIQQLAHHLEKERADIRKKLAPVGYRSDLTDHLKLDHQILLNLYADILAAANAQDFHLMISQLKAFKGHLKSHLAEEYGALYVFAEHYAHGYSPDDKARIREFRNEMNIIGGAVMGILNKYEQSDIDDSTIHRFIEEFRALESVLTERLEREESLLYPLYDDYGARFG